MPCSLWIELPQVLANELLGWETVESLGRGVERDEVSLGIEDEVYLGESIKDSPEMVCSGRRSRLWGRNPLDGRRATT
jgi:hypothetical protein